MDKLQELTQKLYEEGLSKGKADGEQMLEKARAQAEEIIKEAQRKADEIVARAHKEADDYRTKVEGDVKMAATQTIQETKAGIENMIVAQAVDAPVKAALADDSYIKEIITAVAAKFQADEATDISLILPESMKAKLEPYVKETLAKTIGKGVDVNFSRSVSGGFHIGPKDGSWFISLSDESFAELIGSYLRPATKKLLFG